MNKKITISLVVSFLITTNSNSNTQYQFEPITVYSATKNEQSIKDVTANMDIITAEQIEQRGYTSLLDALNSINGVAISQNGSIGSTSSFYLRGNDNNRIVLLINGVRYVDHSSTSGSDLSHIMLGNIERIEVIKGAQSGIWGANASAGVINIVTKDAKEGFGGGFDFEFGSFDTKKANLNLSYANEDFDLLFNLNKIDTQSFTSYAPRGEDIEKYEDDAYENTTIDLKGNWYINSYSKLGFNFSNIEAIKNYDAGWPTDPNDGLSKEDLKAKFYSVYYSAKIENHDLNLSYEGSNTKRDMAVASSPKYNKSITENVELKDVISYRSEDFLLLGVGLAKDELEYVDSKKINNDSKYLYVTNSNIFGDFVLTQSLRYDDYDNFDSKATGKVGARYNFTKNISAFTNYGTSYVAPLLIENLNPYGVSNFNIEPEEGKSFDIGFEIFGFSAVYFYDKIDNLIEWYDPNSLIFGDEYYTNIEGESLFKGLELEYKQDLLDQLTLNLGYTRLSAKDKDGNDLLNRPKDALKFGLDYFGIKNLNISVFGEYIGDRYSYGSPKNIQTGHYTLWNTAVNYEISKNVSVYAKMDNIFDKYYQVVDGYATAPRSVYFGLRAQF